MGSEAEVLKEARQPYDQFLLALKIETASNIFAVLVVAVAFYIVSDDLRLLAWFKASAVAFALGAATAAVAYFLVSRARERVISRTGQSGSAAPAGQDEDRTRVAAPILAFVSMFLFSIGSFLPIVGWFLF